MKRVIFIAMIAILFLSACGSSPQVAPTVDTQSTAEAMVGTMVAQTMQAIPTATLIPPTQTPQSPTLTFTPIVLLLDTATPAAPTETIEPTLDITAWTPTAVEYGPNFVRLKLVNNSTKGCYWVQFAGGETYDASVCSESLIYIRKGSYAYVVYFGLQRTYEGSITIIHKDQHAFVVDDDKVKFIIP